MYVVSIHIYLNIYEWGKQWVWAHQLDRNWTIFETNLWAYICLRNFLYQANGEGLPQVHALWELGSWTELKGESWAPVFIPVSWTECGQWPSESWSCFQCPNHARPAPETRGHNKPFLPLAALSRVLLAAISSWLTYTLTAILQIPHSLTAQAWKGIELTFKTIPNLPESPQ